MMTAERMGSAMVERVGVPRFVGNGPYVKTVVLAVVMLIVLALLALGAVGAGRMAGWWRAPIPTRLPRDLPAVAVPPVPIGNVGSWFPPDAYPPAARRAGAEGRVTVTLLIDEAGAATACEVTGSSGSATLDAATCRLFVRHGRFSPARDRAGRPVRSRLAMRGVRWQLEN